MRRGEFLVDRHGRTTWRMLFKFVLVLCASFFMHKYVMEPLGRVTDLFNIDCSAQMEGSDGSRVDVGAPRADSKTLDPITALPIAHLLARRGLAVVAPADPQRVSCCRAVQHPVVWEFHGLVFEQG